VALLLAAGLAGCGSSDLKVSAASSLKGAFATYGRQFGHVSFSFAGSDQLAAQIRAGARPDVFVAANAKLPDALYAAKLVSRPVPFATNSLVLAVPARGGSVGSLADAGHRGVRIAVGSPTVPVGAYTLTVIGRLGSLGRAIKANIRSQEPDDASIVGKLTTGAVDAGFVYATDVRASKGALRQIPLPAATVVYEASVVSGAPHPSRARDFIAGLVSGAGRAALAAAGFGPAP
jgi:molybdate transport system substrate-binding protein